MKERTVGGATFLELEDSSAQVEIHFRFGPEAKFIDHVDHREKAKRFPDFSRFVDRFLDSRLIR
jgi:hypothetical protein